MSAFSNPRGGNSPNENGGVKGEEGFGLAGQRHSGHSTASIISYTPCRCSPGSSETGSDLHNICASGFSRGGDGGNEHFLESTGVEKTPTVPETFPLHRNRRHSQTEVDEEDDASSDVDVVHFGNDVGFNVSGMVAAPHEAMLMMPEEFSEGAIGEVEDGDIAAADWLDVTHALLDTVSESEGCC